MPDDRRRQHHDQEGFLDGGMLAEQRRLNGSRRFGRVRRVLERIEDHEDRAGIGRVGEGRAGEADERDRMRDARRLERDVDGVADHLVGARKRRARRQLRHHDQIAAVELRDEALRRRAELVEADRDHAGIEHQHDHGEAHRPAATSGRSRRQTLEGAVEQRKKPWIGRTRHPGASGSCGLSTSAHIAGDSVSDTISEITVAPAMVSANWR